MIDFVLYLNLFCTIHIIAWQIQGLINDMFYLNISTYKFLLKTVTIMRILNYIAQNVVQISNDYYLLLNSLFVFKSLTKIF